MSDPRAPGVVMRQLPVTGPNPQKSRFFAEVAAAMEFLELWHTLSADQQSLVNDALSRAAAANYQPARSQK